MMRTSFKLITILMVAAVAFSAFSQSLALRHPATDNAAVLGAKSAVRDGKVDVSKVFGEGNRVMEISSEYMIMRNTFDEVISVLTTPRQRIIEDAQENTETPAQYAGGSMLDEHAKSMFYTSSNATLSRVSLTAQSQSQKTISICAIVTSNGMMDSIGISSLKIQRYFKGRWLTISNVTGLYNSNSTYFMYYTARSGLISGNYYRVTATFIGIHDDCCYTVTKTTQAIRCR